MRLHAGTQSRITAHRARQRNGLTTTCSSNQAQGSLRFLQDSINVPLPTYFTIGDRPLPTHIVEKIVAATVKCVSEPLLLGKRGILKTTDGIRTDALGGRFETVESQVTPATKPMGDSSRLTATLMLGRWPAHSADIRITNQWRTGIHTGSRIDSFVTLHTNMEAYDRLLCSTCK